MCIVALHFVVLILLFFGDFFVRSLILQLSIDVTYIHLRSLFLLTIS